MSATRCPPEWPHDTTFAGANQVQVQIYNVSGAGGYIPAARNASKGISFALDIHQQKDPS